MKYEVFCDSCKVYPAGKLHTLIVAHDCCLVVSEDSNYSEHAQLDVAPSST